MDELDLALLKLLTAGPFQRDPKPKITIPKLVTALARMKFASSDSAKVVKSLQTMKARGFANTIPKILMPEEIETAQFVVWITPLGRDTLKNEQASQ